MLTVAIGYAIHGAAPSIADGAICGVSVCGGLKYSLRHPLESTPTQNGVLVRWPQLLDEKRPIPLNQRSKLPEVDKINSRPGRFPASGASPQTIAAQLPRIPLVIT